MKRIALLMVVLMTTLLLAQSANAGDRDHVRLEGVIAEVNHRGIVLHTRRGNVRIVVTPDTRIIRNGEHARLSDLQVRDRADVFAKIVYRGDRRVLVALGIRARGH